MMHVDVDGSEKKSAFHECFSQDIEYMKEQNKHSFFFVKSYIQSIGK
jgi:hypothetical protein